MSVREREDRRKRLSKGRAWAEKEDRRGSSCIKMPQGVQPYKLELGKHSVDFMLYRAGKFNKEADEGFPHFELTYAIHRIPVGGNNTEWVCCLWECFKKPCPVCKWMAEHKRSHPELYKSLMISTRHLWVVNDKPGDEKNPLKVLDTNHYKGFGEKLREAMKRRAEYGDFAELEGGFTVQMIIKEETWPGGKYNAVSDFDFHERNYDYPESMLDRAPCLDDCLIEMDPKLLSRMLDDGDPEPEAPPEPRREERDGEDSRASRRESARVDEEPPPRRRSRTEDDDDQPPPRSRQDDKPEPSSRRKEQTADELGLQEGDTVIYDDDVKCKITKISRDGTLLNLKSDDGDVYKEVTLDTVKVPSRRAPKEDDDSPPARRSRAPKQEEDDNPPPRSRSRSRDEENDDEPLDDDEGDEDEGPRRGGRRR